MMMTDKELSDLFAAGTAPDRDPAFIVRVASGISQARLRKWRVALALRTAVMLMFSGVIFVTGRMIGPLLAPLVDGLPQFMGVPLPVVLSVLVVVLALHAQRYLLPRRIVVQ